MIDKAISFGAPNLITGSAPSLRKGVEAAPHESKSAGFVDLIKGGIEKTNEAVTDFEKISEQFAAGEKVNIHELMIKGEQASISFQLMLSMRSKVIDAYQEVMRMQV